MSLDALYSPAVFRLAAEAHGAGRLTDGDARVTVVNPTCGDRIDLAITVCDNAISKLVYEVQACLICQASASALGATAIGKTASAIRSLRVGLEAMLKDGAGPPDAMFAPLFPVAAEKSRHSCVLLPLDAAIEALQRHDAG